VLSRESGVAVLSGRPTTRISRHLQEKHMPTSPDNERVLKLLIDRGVLAKDMDVAKLTAVSRELQGLHPGDIAGWTLISKDYVLTGKALDPGTQVGGR
jgi:hypothetical protein